MLDEDENLICNVCSSDLAPGACEADSASKILACKHRFCKSCLKSRIRILKQDKLMVVRCPVDGCGAITAKNLPENYKYEKEREKHRFSLLDTAQKLKLKTVSSHKKSSRSHRNAVNSEKIVESTSASVSSYLVDNPGTQAAIRLLLRGIFQSTAALYAAQIIAVAAGLTAGFDIGYSHTLNSLSNHDVKLIYALLLCALFSVEILANFSGLKFITQSTFLGSLDTLAILLLGITAFGKLDFGYCHSLDRYLVMFTNKYMVALFVGSLVTVEASLLVLHYGALLVNAITSRIRGPLGLIHDSPNGTEASQESSHAQNALNGQKHAVFSPAKDFEFTYMTPNKTQSSGISNEAQTTPYRDSNNHHISSVNSVGTANSAVFSAAPSPQSALNSVRKRVDFDLQDYSCGATPFDSAQTSATSVDDEVGCATATVASIGVSSGPTVKGSPEKGGLGWPSSPRTDAGAGEGQCSSAQKNIRAATILAGMQTPTDDTDSDVEVNGHEGSYSSARYKHGVLDTTPYISSTDTSIAHYASPPCSTSAAENDITLDVFTTTPCRVNGFDLAASDRSGVKKEFLYGTPTPSVASYVAHKTIVADTRDVSHTTTAEEQSAHTTQSDERPLKPLQPVHSTRNTYDDESFQSTYNPLCAYSHNPFPATPDYNHQHYRAGNYFESPEEEDFKLHSNIKLKPLGSWDNRVCDLTSAVTEPTASAREDQQGYEHTYLLGASNFSTPTSPAAPSSFMRTISAATSAASASACSSAVVAGVTSTCSSDPTTTAAAAGQQSSRASNASLYSGAVSAFGSDAPSFKVSDLVSSFEKKSAVHSKGSDTVGAKQGTAKICGKDCVNIVNNKVAKGSVGGKKATTATGFLGSGLSNLIR